MVSLGELREIGVLGGPEDSEFDNIIKLASKMLKAPVALFSVIDAESDRQFFKSATGLDDPWKSMRETPLSHSVCKLVKESNQPIMISDTRLDARLVKNKAAAELNSIAYMGVPVYALGDLAIGALCIIDNEPRDWTDDERDSLLVLAETVSSQIQLKQLLHRQELDRKAADQSNKLLLEKDRVFYDLADNLPGAIFQYKLYPDGRDEVQYISSGCEAIWEISSSEIEGDPYKLWEVIDPADLPDMQASVAGSAERLSRWEHRWRITTDSGKRKWLQGFGTPRREADGSLLWNSLILDVTVEVLAQQKLTENIQRLHNGQKQESIGRIAGGIAHDFNNLMAIVLGNSEALINGDDNNEPEEFLKEIREAALRGGELTKRLLSFARKSELVPEVLNVNTSVAELNDLLRRTIPTSIEIKTSATADLWLSKLDRSFLDSALLNLALNARDAMPDGGVLTIETENVRIDEHYTTERNEDLEPGRYVMLAVTDTGEGIDPLLLPTVFEPFVTSKSADQGTGLGLSMVFGFAKQSGGTARVYSEVGVGTSIKLYLKAHDGEHGPVDIPTPSQLGSKISGSILLAEDENALRRIVRIFLESAGFDVTVAENGDQALKVFLQNPDAFDLIVTDIIMPGTLQGPMMVRKAREIRADLPVVYISGYPHEANVHGNGIRDTDISLTKPLARTTLIAAVEKLMQTAVTPTKPK